MKKTIRIILNFFLFIAPLAAWILMFRGISGVLSSRGIMSLKYFTVLSNLLESAASAVWLLCTFLHGRSHRAEVFKYTACLCVFLTFFTVMVFLGPLFGYPSMFAGANLWLHLIVPVAAIAEMLLLVREPFSIQENLLAVVPVICYGSVYLGNIILHGRGDNVTGWNDFYGFAAWGIPVGMVIFAVICLVVFGAGLLVRKLTDREE